MIFDDFSRDRTVTRKKGLQSYIIGYIICNCLITVPEKYFFSELLHIANTT